MNLCSSKCLIFSLHSESRSFLRYLFKIFRQNLVENLKKGQALVVTLRKKHLALSGMMSREKVKLDSYEEKVNVVNKRYEVLLGELAGKRRREIIELEEEKIRHSKSSKICKSSSRIGF